MSEETTKKSFDQKLASLFAVTDRNTKEVIEGKYETVRLGETEFDAAQLMSPGCKLIITLLPQLGKSNHAGFINIRTNDSIESFKKQNQQKSGKFSRASVVRPKTENKEDI